MWAINDSASTVLYQSATTLPLYTPSTLPIELSLNIMSVAANSPFSIWGRALRVDSINAKVASKLPCCSISVRSLCHLSQHFCASSDFGCSKLVACWLFSIKPRFSSSTKLAANQPTCSSLKRWRNCSKLSPRQLSTSCNHNNCSNCCLISSPGGAGGSIAVPNSNALKASIGALNVAGATVSCSLLQMPSSTVASVTLSNPIWPIWLWSKLSSDSIASSGSIESIPNCAIRARCSGVETIPILPQ